MSNKLGVLAILGLLFCLTAGQKFLNGYTVFDTRVDGDESVCRMVLQSQVSATGDRLVVEQAYRAGPDQPPAQLPVQCAGYKNFYPDSFFQGDTFDPNNAFMVWQNDSNSDFIVQSYFFPSNIQQNNGTTCVSLPQTENTALDQYVCKTRYGSITLYFTVASTGNLTFNTSGSDNFTYFTQGAETMRNISGGSNSIAYNHSFPNIVGNLYDSCNSTNATISSLSNSVAVSTIVDLSANIQGMWLSWVLIRQNGSANGQYVTKSFSGNNVLFGSAPSSAGCWDMGIRYSDLLSDITFCENGCAVSFVLTDATNRIYVLKTNGLTTAHNDSNPNAGNNSTGGNNGGTGSNSTDNNGTSGGNTTNNGTNNGNNGGNNGAAANSALSLSFNMLILLVSLFFLAKF